MVGYKWFSWVKAEAVSDLASWWSPGRLPLHLLVLEREEREKGEKRKEPLDHLVSVLQAARWQAALLYVVAMRMGYGGGLTDGSGRGDSWVIPG